MAASYLKPLETIGARKGRLSTVFADFVRLAACCLSPRTPDGLSVREADYLETISRYDAGEAALFTEAYHTFIEEAERNPHCDILGPLWLDSTSKWSKQARGEFYTPPELCRLIARMTFDMEEAIASGRPVRICEPACGAGAMILAAAELFAPDHWHLPRFTAIDLNPVACDMTFINTTLWSVPCEVICGNALFLRGDEPRQLNLHWLRVGEEEHRRVGRILELLRSPEQASAPAPLRFYTQPDLFSAA